MPTTAVSYLPVASVEESKAAMPDQLSPGLTF